MNDFRKQFGSAQEGQVPEVGECTNIFTAGLNIPADCIDTVAEAIGHGVEKDHVDPVEISVKAKNAAQDSVSLEFKTVGAGGGLENKGEVDIDYDMNEKMADGRTRREMQEQTLFGGFSPTSSR